MEFSQKICLFLIFFGILGVIASYILAFMGYPSNETVTLALITEIILSCLGYLMYQLGLKTSRNKYSVDENGIPFNWNRIIETDELREDIIENRIEDQILSGDLPEEDNNLEV